MADPPLPSSLVVPSNTTTSASTNYDNDLFDNDTSGSGNDIPLSSPSPIPSTSGLTSPIEPLLSPILPNDDTNQQSSRRRHGHGHHDSKVSFSSSLLSSSGPLVSPVPGAGSSDAVDSSRPSLLSGHGTGNGISPRPPVTSGTSRKNTRSGHGSIASGSMAAAATTEVEFEFPLNHERIKGHVEHLRSNLTKPSPQLYTAEEKALYDIMCFLPTISLFASCSRDTLFGLATSVKKRTFPANLAIVTEGSRANECYLIRTGKATAKIRVKYRLSPAEKKARMPRMNMNPSSIRTPVIPMRGPLAASGDVPLAEIDPSLCKIVSLQSFGPSEIFGEEIVHNQKRLVTVMSNTEIHMYTLSRSDLVKFLAPSVIDQLVAFVDHKEKLLTQYTRILKRQFQHAIFAGQTPKSFGSFIEQPLGARLETQNLSMLFPGVDAATRHDRAMRGMPSPKAKLSQSSSSPAIINHVASPYTDFTSSFGFAGSGNGNGDNDDDDHTLHASSSVAAIIPARSPTFITSPSSGERKHERRPLYRPQIDSDSFRYQSPTGSKVVDHRSFLDRPDDDLTSTKASVAKQLDKAWADVSTTSFRYNRDTTHNTTLAQQSAAVNDAATQYVSSFWSPSLGRRSSLLRLPPAVTIKKT